MPVLIPSSDRDCMQPAIASLIVLQGFFRTFALGVASGKSRAAHNVAAIFALLKDDFEIRDAFDERILKRFWSWLHLNPGSPIQVLSNCLHKPSTQ